jgi:hypothetical protein
MWSLAAAACVMIAFGIFALPLLRDDSGVFIPYETSGTTASESTQVLPPSASQEPPTKLAGLPTGTFRMDEVASDPAGMMSSRVAHLTLLDFFRWGMSPQAFVFVRVTDTQLKTFDVSESFTGQGEKQFQLSTVDILETIWNSYHFEQLPQKMNIYQEVHSGNWGMEVTNLLREGGVYLLPIWLHNCEEDQLAMWRIMGDLDVLFEVDDKGSIWSHSLYWSEFTQFDGEPAKKLADEITALTSCENFDVAISAFGWMTRHAMLAEVTVTSSTSHTTNWGSSYYRYNMEIDVITIGEDMDWWQNSNIISAVSYNDSLKVGGRYLIFLERFGTEDSPSILTERAAQINEDGTFTAIDAREWFGTAVFGEWEGYTVVQMREFAERAQAWHNENPTRLFR